MIDVLYDRRKPAVTIEGHSRYAPRGEDLVCAAVTILAHTLADNVRQLLRRFGGDGVTDVDDGNGTIWFTPDRAADKEEACMVFDAVCAGYRLLSERFPEYVQYEELG